MPNSESVTHWIRRLRSGDEEAARLLWQRYFERLVSYARQRLRGAPRRVEDEEDVALSVFRVLCEGATRGKFSEVADRTQLWRLMTAIAGQKAIDYRRRLAKQKRGGGKIRGDSVLDGAEANGHRGGLDQIMGDELTPEVRAVIAEGHQRLMDLLEDDRLRQIAEWKLEGYTNEEISERLGLVCRSVERKLLARRTSKSQAAICGNRALY